MTTDKVGVTGYLSFEANDTLLRYADRNRITKCVAVERLIIDSLTKGILLASSEAQLSSDYEKRLKAIEKKLEKSLLNQRFLTEVNDRLDRQLAEAQCAH